MPVLEPAQSMFASSALPPSLSSKNFCRVQGLSQSHVHGAHSSVSPKPPASPVPSTSLSRFVSAISLVSPFQPLQHLSRGALAGRFSDIIIAKWRRRRNGLWVPEDRLRGTMVGAAVMVPLSVLLSGVFTHFVSGNVGIALNLGCLFANGLGVDFVLSPSASYSVDILHSRSAEIMAAISGFRGILLALITAAVLPSVNFIGVLYTDLISAVLAWVRAILMWILINYGDRMRAWKDVGFSTIENA